MNGLIHLLVLIYPAATVLAGDYFPILEQLYIIPEKSDYFKVKNSDLKKKSFFHAFILNIFLIDLSNDNFFSHKGFLNEFFGIVSYKL